MISFNDVDHSSRYRTFNTESIACHPKKHHCFSVNVQLPDITPLHPPNIHMVELSPAGTKCTHGVAVKLFCR